MKNLKCELMKYIVLGMLCLSALGCGRQKIRSEWSNVDCMFIVGSRYAYCDFRAQAVSPVTADKASTTRFSVAGPIVVGVADPGGDPSWGNKVGDVASIGSPRQIDPYPIQFASGGVYLITSSKEAVKLGDLKTPIEGELMGKWSSRACGWLVAASLFKDEGSEWREKLEAALNKMDKGH